jgi:hypothetical protein
VFKAPAEVSEGSGAPPLRGAEPLRDAPFCTAATLSTIISVVGIAEPFQDGLDAAVCKYSVECYLSVVTHAMKCSSHNLDRV